MNIDCLLTLRWLTSPSPPQFMPQPTIPLPPPNNRWELAHKNAIVVVTGRIRDGTGDSTSTIWNDPQNRTRRELIKRRQLGDIAGKSTPTSSKAAHFTPIPKPPVDPTCGRAGPRNASTQLDWHREEYGQGVGECTSVVALSGTTSTKERAASTDSELLCAHPYIWAFKWSCRSTTCSR